MATNLVEANLRGHDSHGVGMVPRYIDALKEGGLNVEEHVEIRLDGGATLSLDGVEGYGQVIGHEAMELGIERARRHGVCVVGLAHSHHLGRIGHWAEQVTAQGLVSIHFVNVLSRPIVAPFGGRDARFGTNPFCVGVPRAGTDPIVLDFATSKIAQGKTRVAHNKGVPIEPDTHHRQPRQSDDRPALHGDRAARRAADVRRPQGLGPGARSASCSAARWPAARRRGRSATGAGSVLNSMFSIVVDPAALGARREPGDRDGALRRWYAASPPAGGVDRVLVAGEPERAWKARRLAEGIPVDSTTWEEIVGAANKVGLDAATLERLAMA